MSYGADLPEPLAGEGVPGYSVEYQLTLTNTGSVTDYYTLEISSTWGFTGPAQDLGPIEPDESMQFAITVEVPMEAGIGDQGITDISAISIGNPMERDIVTITTTTIFHQFFVPLVMKN
jgi:uncharacterized membrane protein